METTPGEVQVALVEPQSAEPIVPEGPGRAIKVLAAEDNPVYLRLLRGMLNKWGYEVVAAQDGNEAWQALESPDAPRLAILDWMMPGMDGVEICRRLRASGREPYVYILLLTARTDSEDLVQGIEAGADDYLIKPAKPYELRARLRAGRRILELQEQLVHAREDLREQATHDALTCMLNRASVFEALHTELVRAGRERRPIAVLMVDLDHFKQINDTHGHQSGDTVLREAALRMKSCARRYDSLGRYGGEEFLVVLPGCAAAAALAQAERLRESLASAPFATSAGALRVTCSIGVSWRAEPSPGDTGGLIHEADEALYTAKHGGRNQVVAF